MPEMSVYENIFLGHEIKSGLTIDWNKTIQRATEMLKKVRLDVNSVVKVKDLGVGKQQLVEIAKALSRNVKLLILDEPTSALNKDDIDNLFILLRDLKNQGVTCILISHKLREVLEIADMVTVLRDGRTIATLDASKGELSENVLIKDMVGREINNIYPKREKKDVGEIIFEVKHWNAYNPTLGREILKDINFYVRKGEVVGFAGLMGSGRTELALSLFGNPDGYKIHGQILLRGKEVHFKLPGNAIDAGLAYVTEDRKGNGLILIQDVKHNITLANLLAITNNGIIDNNAEVKVANEYKETLNIKTPSVEQKVGNLSGGNQQKVSLGKWLFVKPNILILDEPTRGIDVGAKYEIYTIITRLVQEGMAIMMMSSELPEILGMSDRIYIVSSGRITGECFAIQDATQEKIMRLATG